jgi:hypothetical protein
MTETGGYTISGWREQVLIDRITEGSVNNINRMLHGFRIS